MLRIKDFDCFFQNFPRGGPRTPPPSPPLGELDTHPKNHDDFSSGPGYAPDEDKKTTFLLSDNALLYAPPQQDAVKQLREILATDRRSRDQFQSVTAAASFEFLELIVKYFVKSNTIQLACSATT